MQLSHKEETQIVLSGYWEIEEAERLSKAWLDALAMQHKLPDWIRYINGMSGKKYRYLINNYISETPNARYLEIGSWKGSTACSAIYGNKCKALCIDNWSEFLWGASKNDVKGLFVQNVTNAASDVAEFDYIDSDFRAIDYSNIGKFNIYMFDGPHAERDQYDGFMIAQPALDDIYLLIVDDWNDPKVRTGTTKAIEDLKSTIVCQIEVITRHDKEHPVINMEHSDWHNGYYIAVIKKSSVT